jgi:hypothetical protein
MPLCINVRYNRENIENMILLSLKEPAQNEHETICIMCKINKLVYHENSSLHISTKYIIYMTYLLRVYFLIRTPYLPAEDQTSTCLYKIYTLVTPMYEIYLCKEFSVI